MYLWFLSGGRCQDASASASGGGRQSDGAGPSFSEDLLAHSSFDLRDQYDHVVGSWHPPAKIGKAEFFVYSNVPGDGHIRADTSTAGTAGGGGTKFDLAPLAESFAASMGDGAKLRPLPAKSIHAAFPLEPGHFELTKADIGVSIHKRDRKDRSKGRGAGKTVSKSVLTSAGAVSSERLTRA